MIMEYGTQVCLMPLISGINWATQYNKWWFGTWQTSGQAVGVISLTFHELSKLISQKFDENFKLKLCMCTQSMALCTRTKFQLEILIRNKSSLIHKFERIFWRDGEMLVKHPLAVQISQTTTGFRAWISNYIHTKLWDAVIHSCPKGSLVRLLLMLGHGWLITFHIK